MASRTAAGQRRRRRGLSIGGVALAALAAPLAAQDKVPERTLAKAEAEFPESFDQVSALRELPGGKVLVTDLGPKAVLLVDFASGTQATIGRNGQGPGEYQFPGELLPFRGDTTLLNDRISRRFLTIAPDGKLGRTVPLPDFLAGFPEARGADRSGRVYFQDSPFRGDGSFGSGALPDSTRILRWELGSNRADTLTRVKIPSLKVQVSGSSNQRSVMIRPQPYAAADEWGVSPDGRLAVARVGDYHVEWLGEHPARGVPVRYQPVKVSEADKAAFLSALKNTRNRFTVTRGGAGRAAPPPPSEPRADGFDWPATKPAFVRQSAFVTPEGQFWVQRYTEARDSTPAYDVFDGSGKLTGRVYLPKGRKVVGMGEGTVYAVRTDDDGLQWLERYRR